MLGEVRITLAKLCLKHIEKARKFVAKKSKTTRIAQASG